MKVKVVKKFKDKHTGEIHKVGETLEVSNDRYAEIAKKGNYVEKVEDAGQKKASKTTEK